MEEIKKIIKQFFLLRNKENPKKEIEIFNAWKKTVKKKYFENTEIIKIDEEKLYIKAKNPVYRNEISFNKKNILKKLNKISTKQKIKEIKIR